MKAEWVGTPTGEYFKLMANLNVERVDERKLGCDEILIASATMVSGKPSAKER